MTRITITPDVAKKRLRFRGDAVAAGEHVVVTVAGFADKAGEGSRLRLRVADCNRTVAVFPRTSEDAWIPENENDVSCELNLNTIQMRKTTACGGLEFTFVLDDVSVPQNYGEGRLFVGSWRQEPGIDAPYDLDGYPDVVREFGERLDAFGDDVVAAKEASEAAKASAAQAASDAAGANAVATIAQRQTGEAAASAASAQASAASASESASAAESSAASAEQSASEAVSAVADFKAKFDFSTISELTDADSIRAVKNAFNNLLQKLKAVNP